MGPRALSRFCRRKALRRPARGPNQARFLVHYLLCLFINTLPNRLRPLDTGNVVNCGVSLSLFCFVFFLLLILLLFWFFVVASSPLSSRILFARNVCPAAFGDSVLWQKRSERKKRNEKKKRNSGQTPPHPEARKGSVPVRFPPSRTGSYCVQVALG